MDLPYNQILDSVRDRIAADEAFARLRTIADQAHPDAIWAAIPTPAIATDIESARSWLQRNIVDYKPNGIYLGLDTLNERAGAGKNLEVGMTTQANSTSMTMDW